MHKDAARLILLIGLAIAAVSGRAWAQATITTLDSAGDVGRDSDVAYGPGGLALVSYLDATNGNLKVAACQNVACTLAVPNTIDASGDVSGSTSIAFGPDGRALVSYQAGGRVKVARCADAICSSATHVTLDPATPPRPGTAIGVGADGLAVVVYGDAVGNRAMVAHCNDAECNTSTITPYAGQGSFRPSVTIGGDGMPLFAIDDVQRVSVFHCANAACTSATSTGITVPPTFPGPYGTMDAALATGADGIGVVATTYHYTDQFGNGSALVVRRCQDVACTSVAASGPLMAASLHPSLGLRPGNLPLVASFGQSFPQHLRINSCTTPDCVPPPLAFAIESTNIGQRPELAVGPDGIGLVSYQHETDADLRVAYLNGGPVLSIADGQVVEGHVGLTSAAFDVRLDSPATVPVTVSYATQAGNATPNVDYLTTSGALTFAPGALSQVVTVSVIGDLQYEGEEIFLVLLSNAQGAPIGDDSAFGQIFDDDVQATASGVPLEHGTSLVRDLAADPGPAAHVDLFRIAQAPFASYEVVVDATAGEVDPLDVRRVGPDGQNTLQTASPTGTGTSLGLRWQVSTTFPHFDQMVRVSAACGTGCAPGSTYRIRAYETTLRGSRFNNSASQTTVLLLQNPGTTPVATSVWFWSASGSPLWAQSATIEPKALLILPTSGLPGLAGQSGSVTVQHDAPYGVLVGKSVALEPTTGFSFDTPLHPKPR